MMNVAVVTIHDHLNYGAVLQAFALNKIVRELGHQCRTIDLGMEPASSRRYSRSKHPGEQLKNLYLLFHRNDNHRHRKRFGDFVRRHIPLSDVRYQSLDQLVASPPQFDVYVTGSDQVWHPVKLDRAIGHAFHLSFAASDRHRLVAYAPSFGVSDIPERHVPRLREYLFRYHSLSVREKSGQEIVSRLTGKEAEIVLDPTLLLRVEEYRSIARVPSISEEYLLVYPMELGMDGVFWDMVRRVKERLSLQTVILLPLRFHYRWLLLADKTILDAGPAEFLGLFDRAAFVCTNSFHGTAFSVLFQKGFLCAPHSVTNSRVHSLLEQLGLLSRQVISADPQRIQKALSETMDYARIRRCLDDRVRRSIAYLEGALAS
jgi:hypothetical protein